MKPPPEPGPEPLAARAYRVFADLLELEGAERPAALDRACAGDGALRAEVEALLAADSGATGLLDGQAAELANTAFSTPLADTRSGSEPAGLEPGSRLGAYRLERELGRGGMGRVFEARRADGTLDRAVAIKILHAGPGETESWQQRFLDEGRALAQLEHPHIARVFDAGIDRASEDRPARYFLVMEHIDGVPVTEHAAELPLEERVDLFVKVCEAVEAAHARRLVHRDVKPSNILVDRAGRPKLLDFGIALFLDRPVAENTHLQMTPAYAAPEQVRSEAITPATDVYALGLLLYELLTFQRAVDLRDGNLSEMVRQICEVDPPPPSMALGEELSSSSAPLQELRQKLRGDLDTIVMKALRKDPAQRYGSAAALAEDLRRRREGRPILARPAGPLERTAKLVRRRPRQTAALGLVTLALLVSALVMDAERRRADRLRAQAELETEKAERVSELMRRLFESSRPAEALGVDAPALDLLQSGVEQAEEAESPELRAELLTVLARAYDQLGRPDEAATLRERAAELEPEDAEP